MPLAIERKSSSEILPDPDAVMASLYAELSRTGFRPVRAVQRIAACNIMTLTHAFWGASRKAMRACLIERISYLSSGRVVEFTKSLYRGDAYDFVAELTIPVAALERAFRPDWIRSILNFFCFAA